MRKPIKKKWIIISILIIISVSFVVWFINDPYRYLYRTSYKMEYTPSESEYEAFLSSFGILNTDNIIAVEEYSFNDSESYIYSYKLDLKVKDIYLFFTENVICEGDVYIDSEGNICFPEEWYSNSIDNTKKEIYTITRDGKEVTTTSDGTIRYIDASRFKLRVQNRINPENSSNDYITMRFIIKLSEDGDIIVSCYDPTNISESELLIRIYEEHFYDDLFSSWIFNL